MIRDLSEDEFIELSSSIQRMFDELRILDKYYSAAPDDPKYSHRSYAISQILAYLITLYDEATNQLGRQRGFSLRGWNPKQYQEFVENGNR